LGVPGLRPFCLFFDLKPVFGVIWRWRSWAPWFLDVLGGFCLPVLGPFSGPKGDPFGALDRPLAGPMLVLPCFLGPLFGPVLPVFRPFGPVSAVSAGSLPLFPAFWGPVFGRFWVPFSGRFSPVLGPQTRPRGVGLWSLFPLRPASGAPKPGFWPVLACFPRFSAGFGALFGPFPALPALWGPNPPTSGLGPSGPLGPPSGPKRAFSALIWPRFLGAFFGLLAGFRPLYPVLGGPPGPLRGSAQGPVFGRFLAPYRPCGPGWLVGGFLPFGAFGPKRGPFRPVFGRFSALFGLFFGLFAAASRPPGKPLLQGQGPPSGPFLGAFWALFRPLWGRRPQVGSWAGFSLVGLRPTRRARLGPPKGPHRNAHLQKAHLFGLWAGLRAPNRTDPLVA